MLDDEDVGHTSSDDKVKALCLELDNLKKNTRELESEHQLELNKGKCFTVLHVHVCVLVSFCVCYHGSCIRVA